MKKIAVEEHFFTEDYLLYLHSRTEEPRRQTVDDSLSKTLINIEERLKAMDDAGINMQVLSLQYPGIEDLNASDGVTWAKKQMMVLLR